MLLGNFLKSPNSHYFNSVASQKMSKKIILNNEDMYLIYNKILSLLYVSGIQNITCKTCNIAVQSLFNKVENNNNKF